MWEYHSLNHNLCSFSVLFLLGCGSIFHSTTLWSLIPMLIIYSYLDVGVSFTQPQLVLFLWSLPIGKWEYLSLNHSGIFDTTWGETPFIWHILYVIPHMSEDLTLFTPNGSNMGKFWSIQGRFISCVWYSTVLYLQSQGCGSSDLIPVQYLQ